MAVFTCNFHSDILGYETQIRVVLPEEQGLDENLRTKKYNYKVLYLLHGRGDDSTSWSRFVPIERYAAERHMAVVMPEAEDSFYTDSVGGKQFFTYISRELPEKIKAWFPISEKREDTYIAGLSMGGYGALKTALTYPAAYASAGAFSAVTDITQFVEAVPESLKEDFSHNMERVYGDYKNPAPENDLLKLYEQAQKKNEHMPKIHLYIGQQDFLYTMNRRFYDSLKNKGASPEYEEWQGGHEWTFWDKAIVKYMNSLVQAENA